MLFRRSQVGCDLRELVEGGLEVLDDFGGQYGQVYWQLMARNRRYDYGLIQRRLVSGRW